MNEKSRRKAYVTNISALSNDNSSVLRGKTYYTNTKEIDLNNNNSSNNRGNNISGFNNNNFSNESNVVLDDFPKLPLKNIESCEDVYNIFYIRDQYIIGNKNISINNDHIILLETILDKIDTAISEMCSEENYSTKKILASVHEKIYNLYNSFKKIKNIPPELSNAYDCFKSNVIFVRSRQFKKNYVYDNLINIYTYLRDSELQQDNIETINEPLYINDKAISTASFINKNMLTANEYIEYLPMKFNPHFLELNKISIYYLYEESINHIIWQKALDELIVVKALADIPYFDLSEVEGFDFKKMKSGQRQWYPLYIAKELSEEGLATVEFPFWFYIDNLKNIYKKEFEDLFELTDLPSPFFFEISSMFLENNSFKNSTPIETIGHRTPYKYILKVAGLIQDIRQKRIHKIMNKFKSCDIFSDILIINNIQIYETYCVNYLASVFFQRQSNTNAINENFDVRNYLFDPFIFSSYNV
ncbi:DNA replication complex GINS protein, putative [Plasmodium malariae]|uniref:DNA replication complex GINS protein, putative n=2 Tax=Plasmodium (Plasmodium) TaxID=418103 RepID=A0A1D3PAP2_PLAMA|nr:DNA replication complex GINS protein, putative [Plasmodium malariae]SCN12262.1 DNA replication complex GINS protein, putative [Plasmodium malariae]